LKKEEAPKEEKKEDDYVGKIIDGVEVVDVKDVRAIPKDETKLAVPEKRKTWDKP
jgi:hypothetical protein